MRPNATRDYIDFVALADYLGEEAIVDAMRPFDHFYPQSNDESPLQQLVVQLANPLPYDLDQTDLANYKGLDKRWHDWSAVKSVAQRIGTVIFARLIEPEA
jgi:hypothetical protein